MFCTELAEHETAIICDFQKFYNIRAIKAGQSYTMTEALAFLEGLTVDSGSLYFASKAGWKYPMSRLELMTADEFDLHVAINSDPKKPNNFRYERPFEMLRDGQEHHAGTKMSIEKAEKYYNVPVQTKTDAEVIEINRLKVLAKKNQKAE